MKTKLVKIVLWLLISIAVLNIGFNMVSAPDTIQNIAGFIIIVSIWVNYIGNHRIDSFY